MADWAPDVEQKSSKFLPVTAGVCVTLKKHSRGWWLGFDAEAPVRAVGWLTEVPFALWEIEKAFDIDDYHTFQTEKDKFLKLSTIATETATGRNKSLENHFF